MLLLPVGGGAVLGRGAGATEVYGGLGATVATVATVVLVLGLGATVVMLGLGATVVMVPGLGASVAVATVVVLAVVVLAVVVLAVVVLAVVTVATAGWVGHHTAAVANSGCVCASGCRRRRVAPWRASGARWRILC